MQEFYEVQVEGTNIIDRQPLFAECDKQAKEIAENILNQLQGTKILTAQLILKKCEIALMQSNVSFGQNIVVPTPLSIKDRAFIEASKRIVAKCQCRG